MLNLNCKIKVYETENLHPKGKVYEFLHVNDIKINSSYKKFTDTATITIPKAVIVRALNNSLGVDIAKRLPFDLEQKSIYEFFKLDNLVEVFLGYDEGYKLAFRGYIKEVKGDAPVEIFCEDMMYYLKKHKMVESGTSKPNMDNSIEEDDKNQITKNESVSVSKVEETLKRKLKEIKVPFKVKDFKFEDLGEIIIDRRFNIVQFLRCLKERFDIYSYIQLEWDESNKNYVSVLHITSNPWLYSKDNISNILKKYKNTDDKTPLPEKVIKRAFSLVGIDDVKRFLSKRKDKEAYIENATLRFHYNIIKDNLKLIDGDVRKVRVRAEANYINTNVAIPAEIGDNEGRLEKLYIFHYNDTSLKFEKPEIYKEEKEKLKAKLEVISGLRLAKLKAKGLTGAVTTFGEPFVRPLDSVNLKNAEDPEKNNVFQVEEVQRSYGVDGYRQEITLGRLLTKEKIT